MRGVEALACGIPAVGSKVDGSRETLLDGKLGRLVDPNAPEELVKAITLLCYGSARQRNGNCFDVAHFRRHQMLDETDSKRSKP